MYLPIEILHYIIDMVPIEEQIINLRGVCSDWRNKILNRKSADLTGLLKRKIDFRLLLILNPEKLKNLTIKDNIINARNMSKILKRYNNLTDLNLINIDTFWSSFTNITRHKKLVNLNLSSSGILVNYTLFLISINCPKIEKLVLQDHVSVNKNLIDLILTRYRSLKILDIRGCNYIVKENITNLVSSYKNIKILY